MVRGSNPTRVTDGENSFSVHPAANGYPHLPYLAMAWLSKCAPLTKHIPDALVEYGTTFTLIHTNENNSFENNLYQNVSLQVFDIVQAFHT